MSNIDWDRRYMEMARLVAGWSKDKKAKVGAVIVRENRVVATGFNGFPAEVEDLDERLKDQAKKLEMIVHAEQNALIVAGKSAEGATIYVHGKPVCATCAGAIIQAQIKRVVGPNPHEVPLKPKSKWRKSGIFAYQMFTEAHVIFHPRTIATGRDGVVELVPAKDLVVAAEHQQRDLINGETEAEHEPRDLINGETDSGKRPD